MPAGLVCLYLTLAAWLLPALYAKKAGSVTLKRILSEWKEITAAKIDLSIPFNASAHEVRSFNSICHFGLTLYS